MAQLNSFVKIKAPNQKSNFTQAQFEEFLKCAQDPLYFMEKYIYIQHPTQGRLPLRAYPFQKKLVETYWKNKNSIAMIPRQSGKCVTADINITVRNKITGNIYDVPIGIYFEWQACMRDGRYLPDISKYQRTNQRT